MSKSSSSRRSNRPPTVIGKCHFKDTLIMDHSRHYSAISGKGKEYLLHPNTIALKNCPLISNVEMKTLEQNFTSSFNELPKEVSEWS